MFNMGWGEGGNCGGSSSPKVETIVKNNYFVVVGDPEYIYTLEERGICNEFKKLKQSEPQLKLSNFEGCPHWYGIMYMPDGRMFELQVKITKGYLNRAKQMKGDWNGYNEGDYTGRFLSKMEVTSAFNLFKEIVK